MQTPQSAEGDLSQNRRILAVGLLMLSLVCEGIELQAANFAAADLVATLGIPRAQMGSMLSASLVGMLLGAPLIGGLGDRFGRKAIVVGGTLGYGALSLVTTQFDTLLGLTALRFLTGLALGAVLPNALILAAEFAPPKLQVKAAALVTVGISIGSAATGFIAAALMPEYGWRSLFIVGGVAPIAVAVLLVWAIPESPLFLRRVAIDPKARKIGNPAKLFAGRLATITPAIWLVFALLSMCLYLLAGWIPMLLNQSGLSMRDTALVSGGYHLGGVVGSIAAAFFIARTGWATLGLFLVGAAAMLLVLALFEGSPLLLVIGLATAGFFVVGSQTSINGATTVAFPTEISATGVGWTLGVARLGSICGPLVGAAAVGLGMTSARQLFLVAVLPLALAAVGSAYLSWRTRAPV